MTTSTLPPLTGTHRGYRLFGHEFGTFDELRAQFPGAALVTRSKWGTSTSSICGFLSSPEVAAEAAADPTPYTVNVYWIADDGDLVKHALDGTKFATWADADRAKFDAGIVAFMVYEEAR